MDLISQYKFDGFHFPRNSNVIEIELTSKCVLGCSMCPRNQDHDQSHSKWKLGEIDVSAIEKLAFQIPMTRSIILCGGYGDPIYHTRLFDIIDILHKYDKSIHLVTAGNLRKSEWWQELAKKLRRTDVICFSVDGLEHNNHLYRKNSVWNSIHTAMQIMGTESECMSVWKWILFKYNENDVVEGFKLSRKLGITAFEVVSSGRIPPGFTPTKTLNQVLEEIEIYKFRVTQK
jgi:MoaA/NifB/PqqE/SkfB family radical SAM enzyme